MFQDKYQLYLTERSYKSALRRLNVCLKEINMSPYGRLGYSADEVRKLIKEAKEYVEEDLKAYRLFKNDKKD